MEIRDDIKEIIIKIITKIDDDIIFCGGIADYFNFIKFNVNIGNTLSDVDVNVYDESTIVKLEELFNSKAIFVDLPNEDVITPTNNIKLQQYYINICSLKGIRSHIDIFLIKNINDFNAIGTEKFKYKDKELKYVNMFERYEQLNATINHWYSTAPMTKRTLKYLRKRMVYNKIINNEA